MFGGVSLNYAPIIIRMTGFVNIQMFTILGKKFFHFSTHLYLDKTPGVWYNGKFGPRGPGAGRQENLPRPLSQGAGDFINTL